MLSTKTRVLTSNSLKKEEWENEAHGTPLEKSKGREELHFHPSRGKPHRLASNGQSSAKNKTRKWQILIQGQVSVKISLKCSKLEDSFANSSECRGIKWSDEKVFIYIWAQGAAQRAYEKDLSTWLSHTWSAHTCKSGAHTRPSHPEPPEAPSGCSQDERPRLSLAPL